MGVFLLGSGDYRLGAAGDFRIHANEVAIGLTMPLPALAILRYRLTPSAFDRAVCLAEPFDPRAAVEAGLLDRVAVFADQRQQLAELRRAPLDGPRDSGVVSAPEARHRVGDRALCRALSSASVGVRGERHGVPMIAPA